MVVKQTWAVRLCCNTSIRTGTIMRGRSTPWVMGIIFNGLALTLTVFCQEKISANSKQNSYLQLKKQTWAVRLCSNTSIRTGTTMRGRLTPLVSPILMQYLFLSHNNLSGKDVGELKTELFAVKGLLYQTLTDLKGTRTNNQSHVLPLRINHIIL